ncbi:MAG: potassium channel protein [Deltaproteobacteria bacterium]|nr:MAG: potassium channel protein [Deltaproteobacteria bacterium]
MLKTRHITALLLLLTTVFIGTWGYVVLEHANLLDAFYMTIITLTTVGYKEVFPLGKWGRIFTIFIIFFGMGTVLYLAGSFTQMIIEGELRKILGRRKLENKIKSLRNHVIVCGFGRIGEVVSQEIRDHGSVDVVVIENDPKVLTKLEEGGYLYIPGDATEEDCMMRAGIKWARGLITVLNSDANNVYITLTARNLKPDIFIVARSSSPISEKKLLQAGANKVISPHYLGGKRIAQILLRPTVAEFIDFALHDPDIELSLGEIPVREKSVLDRVTLLESGIRQRLDLIIVAIKKASGEMLFNPKSETVIEAGDTLIALGKKQNLAKLEKLGDSTSVG